MSNPTVLVDRFEIVGQGSSRPEAEKIIFCDGTGGGLFRDGNDLELSHWRPNRTPVEYRAGTSTEICFRFLDDPRPGPWTVAVNNHVDVDGILSVYVLVHRETARLHRQIIVEAAEMGDFWGWGEAPAQRLFQGLTRLMNSGGEGKAIYAEAFRQIPALIDGTAADIAEIEASLLPLRSGVELVEQGRIVRLLVQERLAHYVVPLDVAGTDDERASYCPDFNEAISESALLWPHVRARWDAERVCLVSMERQRGWFHDLWFPGYLWADTEALWQGSGLKYSEGMGSYRLENPRLIAAFGKLQELESASGHWALGGTEAVVGGELQDRFPLVGRFVGERGQIAASRLRPEAVARALDGVFG
ncbi:MAG TPA: DUF6687 family protein [Pirellulales bacterium]|nr:DUF6687 family protein [Pirellulales bacterium]